MSDAVGSCPGLTGVAMDVLTGFGVLAVSAMLAFYALEQRSPRFVLAFAVSCLAASAYGFLSGAWPFGIVELIWSAVAARRWRIRVTSAPDRTSASP